MSWTIPRCIVLLECSHTIYCDADLVRDVEGQHCVFCDDFSALQPRVMRKVIAYRYVDEPGSISDLITWKIVRFNNFNELVKTANGVWQYGYDYGWDYHIYDQPR